MRTYIYECKGEYEGSIKIITPKYTQRIRMFKELEVNYVKDENGNMTVSLNNSLKDNAEMLARMIDLSASYISEVNVKHKAGLEAKSWDDLQDYEEFYPLVNDVATQIFGGTKLGGKQEQVLKDKPAASIEA